MPAILARYGSTEEETLVIIHMVTLFIKEVIIMDSNPGLTDLRALFSTTTDLIYVSPDRVVVRTLLKSHAHSFKTLC